MASGSARRLVQRSTSYAKAFMNSAPRSVSPPSVASGPSKLGGLAPTLPSPAPRLSRRQDLFFATSGCRLPKELTSGESLIPLHSVTDSALLNLYFLQKLANGVAFLKAEDIQFVQSASDDWKCKI